MVAADRDQYNRAVELVVWAVSCLPAAVAAAIGSAFGNKIGSEWSPESLKQLAPMYRKKDE